MTSRFSGFPVEAFEFYDALSAENTKVWWAAHKDEYESLVRTPMTELLAELEGEFGAGHVFRPYRDVRFAKDKTPYKDHQGAFVGAEDSIGWYVQVSRTGLLVAGGWYAAEGRQVQRYREAVDSPLVVELERALQVANKAGLETGGDVMKTRPRGIAEDHPHLDLIRHRTLTVERQHPVEPWVSTRSALTRVRKEWKAMTPLVEWLADHVGPADDGIPPEPR